jgi:probable phosphoglycerate mutase
MLKIYLARHGQDEDNVKGILNGHRDKPLTLLGQDQAKELANKIKEAGIQIDKIYSSPLKRTRQTAEIISDILSLNKPETLDLLIERDFGIMTGRLMSEIETICAPDFIKADLVNYFLSPEGAETFPQLLERGRKILNEIKSKYSDGNILLVTSGDIGKMIYADYYNLGWQEALTMINFGNSDLLLLAQDSSLGETHVFKTKQHNH